MLLRGLDARAEIDLKAAFGDSYATFSVTGTDGQAVDARIAGGILTLDAGAFGFSDLVITATDAAGATVTDNVRVRVAGENAFTIALLPDTQTYTSNPALNATFGNMTQWLADNAESKNIDFVIGLGDVTDNNNAPQWAIASAALHRLDGKIPYSILPGNHDQAAGGSAADHSTTFLDGLFSPEAQRATNPDTFGGAYDREPNRAANTYHTFAAPDGTQWLVLSLEFAPRHDVIRWAGDVIEAHLDHRVIIASHTLTTYAGRSDPMAGLIGAAPIDGYGLADSAQGVKDAEAIYRELTSQYPNVVMTVSGHVLGDSAETNQSYSQHGNMTLEMMADYQAGSTTELSTAGGEGAIRLIVIDPDNGSISTETYFTERDAYLTGFRGKEELDREGLTGPYRGHQETYTGIELGTPALHAQAKAGADLVVQATGEAGTATVALDGSATLNPALVASFAWRDADGRLLASDATGEVTLGIGRHRLQLSVTDREGAVTTDETIVIVGGTGTLLLETFDDGKAQGWGAPAPKAPRLAEKLGFGEPSAFGLPALPGGATGVMSFPATAPTTEGFLIKPAGATGPIRSYTLAFDVLVPTANQGKWFAFLQTDPAQSASNDADFLITMAGGIGINGDYKGAFQYGQWQRVVLTVSDLGNGNATLSKYLDGALVGSQSMPASRYQIDPAKGFLVFSDNAPNAGNQQTQSGHVSSIAFADAVLTAQQVAALGKADANGILDAPPAGSRAAVQYDFSGPDPLAPSFGTGQIIVVQPESVFQATRFGTPETLGTAPLPGGSDAIMAFPATAPDEGYLLKPAGAATLTSYTIIWDIHAPEARNHWMALLQTDPSNASDADFLINLAGGIGINGDYKGSFDFARWQRVALTVKDNGDGTVTLAKYLEGVLVGTQTMPTERYAIDAERGALLFTDNGPFQDNHQTVKAQVNSVLFTDAAMSGAEIAALGGAKAGGILPNAGSAPGNAVQFDFTGGTLAPSFGDGALSLWDKSKSAGLDSWTIKGSIFAPGANGIGEGALHDRSNGTDKLLVWQGEAGAGWSDYSYDVTLTSTDNDKLGVVFRYQDAGNHYRFVMDNEGVARTLVKIKGGVETVLAQVKAGYRFNDELDLRVVVQGDAIDVLLEGRSVFGGPVIDADPVGTGTVGVISSGQKSSIFDDVMVNELRLTAHGETAMRAIAAEGETTALVQLSAASAFGPDAITGYRWLLDGKLLAQGRTAEVALPAGTRAVTLEVTDSAGRIATDIVEVDVVGNAGVLARDGFDGATLGDHWRILDEGTIGGPSDWVIANGRLFQNSNIYSEQLVAGGIDNRDVWQKGWSPLGDGTYVLRKGTTALYEPADEDVGTWRDYSVEASFRTPDDDGVGVVFYYRDPENHYKLELNHQVQVWTLVRLVDGIEEVLGQAWHKYALNQDTTLRIDILDNRISAFVDGEALFPTPIEDRSHQGGTFGLNAWGSQGVSFDDVVVTKLRPEAPMISGDVVLPALAEDGSTILTAAQLLANARDGNGDVLTVVDLAASSGTLVRTGEGSWRFTPTADDDGAVTFTYGVRDGTTTVAARATLDLTPVNDAPVTMASALASPFATDALFRTLGAADLAGFDRDGDVLTFTLTGLATGALLLNGAIASVGARFTVEDIAAGRVTLLAGGVLPEGGFGDAFRYALSDGSSQVDGSFRAGYAAFDTVQTTPQYGGYWGGRGDDYQLGTGNADNMAAGDGSNTLIGQGGNDQLNGGSGVGRLFGGAGNDQLNGGGRADLLVGGDGDDQLNGQGGDNILLGGAGRDVMNAGEGDDRAYGGDGDDTIHVNGGANRIDAGAGNDRITAGGGNDVVIAGAGQDTVYAGGGKNMLQLGGIAGQRSDGNDEFWTGGGADRFVLYLDDRDGNAAGFGRDIIQGFRLAEGDRLIAFSSQAGFWDDVGRLREMAESGFVSGERSRDGGDLALTFAEGTERESSLTLKWFFWDNGGFLSASEKSTRPGAELAAGDLAGILEEVIQDGGVSGAGFLAAAHNLMSDPFLL
jgi:Ca2+-binding RTX toxin-like protein/3',5'-cyclic AMP phosphodiesterase CpdA